MYIIPIILTRIFVIRSYLPPNFYIFYFEFTIVNCVPPIPLSFIPFI